jgi:hypothetical protein
MAEPGDKADEPIRIKARGNLSVCASGAGGRIRGLRLPA